MAKVDVITPYKQKKHLFFYDSTCKPFMELGSHIQILLQSLPKFPLAYTFSTVPNLLVIGPLNRLMLDLLHLNRYVDRHFYQNHQYGLLKFTIKHTYSSGPLLFVACCDSQRNLSNSHTCPIRNVLAHYMNGKFHWRWISAKCLACKHYFTEKNVFSCIDECFVPMSIEAGRERYRRGLIASGR